MMEIKNLWQQIRLAYIACICIVLGMFLSRAFMSIGMMLLFANALFEKNLKEEIVLFTKQIHLYLLTGYFVLMAVSYFWTENTHYYFERLQILLPFFILPFSFFRMKAWHADEIKSIFMLFILLTLGGVCWSISVYLQQKGLYDEAYGRSKMIPTPFKNDHIRFSLGVALAIFLAIELYIRESGKHIKILLSLCIVSFIVYLHILATKSGLLAFYSMSILGIFYLLSLKKYRKHALILVGFILILPMMMYFSSVTLRTKIAYFKYSIMQMQNNLRETQISDEGRLISYQYALSSIAENPLLGVGVGDVFDEMQYRYKKDFPDKIITVLLPHNQFLMAGMSVGILGIVYLFAMIFFIFKKILQEDFLTKAYLLVMTMMMFIEPLFETQFGTCMFLFFLLLLLHRHRTNVA